MSGQDARYTIFEALRKPIAWLFKTDDEHATIYCLFNSKHVQDLQLIIGVSSLAVLLIVIARRNRSGFHLQGGPPSRPALEWRKTSRA